MNVVSNISVGEFATMTQIICNIWRNYREKIENAELDGYFEQTNKEAADIIIAINRMSAESGVEAANAARNVTVRNLFTMLDGACVSLFAEEAEAAKKMLEVANHYGRKMTTEKQLQESAHIESLLNDYASAEMKSAVAKVHGGAEYVARLAEEEKIYKAAKVEQNRINSLAKVEKSATKIKNELREFLNGTIFPHLSARYTLEREKYAEVYIEIEKVVKTTNASARRTPKTETKTEEPAETPTETTEE